MKNLSQAHFTHVAHNMAYLITILDLLLLLRFFIFASFCLLLPQKPVTILPFTFLIYMNGLLIFDWWNWRGPSFVSKDLTLISEVVEISGLCWTGRYFLESSDGFYENLTFICICISLLVLFMLLKFVNSFILQALFIPKLFFFVQLYLIVIYLTWIWMNLCFLLRKKKWL